MIKQLITGCLSLALIWTAPFAAHADSRPHIHNQRHTAAQAQESQSNQPLKQKNTDYTYSESVSRETFATVQQNPQTLQLTEIHSSPIENMYEDRIIDDLSQFGYDMFNGSTASRASNNIPAGATADDFILSYQDELEIVFTGQRSDRGTFTINNEGVLLIEDFPPVPAAGRSLRQVRTAIETAAHSQYNTQAYVALKSVRQIDILIVGDVKQPGRKTLTVFHTILDALSEAGGIDKTGSLRQIKLVRNGRSIFIDLYALLMHGSTNVDMKLRDGDRIVVPSIGPTVAIAGEVKRPGIYEILPALQGMRHAPQSQKLTLNEMLDLSGGILAPGDNRFLKMGIREDGSEVVEDINEPFTPTFGDGSILMISKGQSKRFGTVELTGHTRKPGLHALSENTTLSEVFNSDAILGPDIYPLVGLIERWNPDTLSHQIIDFPLRLVLKGDYDQRLQDGDKITLLSNTQIRALRTADTAESAANLDQGSRTNPEDDTNPSILDFPTIGFLKERSIFIRGAVRQPGSYPISDGTTLDMAIAVAGGLTLEANTTNIEVTTALNGDGAQSYGGSGTRRLSVNFREESPQNITIAHGDAIRVNQKFHKIADQSVLIMGEVTYPGRYDLIPGDQVSDLITRAGGLTQQAYAAGAIFSRSAERKAEESRFRAQARVLRQAVAGALHNGSEEAKSEKINAGQIAEASALAAELEEAQGIGRITVEADPAILSTQDELDMLLESGDRLFIPKRNLTVRVSGEVLSSAALQFREGKKPLDYIHQAGGFTYHADKDRAFVLYPDGSAQPLQVNSWNYTPTFIPPGSTIIVPRDPKPFDFIDSFKDVSQILSNLAVTAIFIDDVRDD